MMQTLTEYDYEPVDYVTLIIYYQSLSQKMTAAISLIILKYYIMTVHIQVLV